jgi:hypothetical protein
MIHPYEHIPEPYHSNDDYDPIDIIEIECYCCGGEGWTHSDEVIDGDEYHVCEICNGKKVVELSEELSREIWLDRNHKEHDD